MPDFLLELRCEEIPARMQAGARTELEKLFRREMDAAGVALGEITVWSTPRRLALIARDLPDATEAVSEEAKGPPISAPDQAVDGFCRKMGVERGQLETRDVKGRATYFAVKNVPGRAMRDLLAEATPAIIRDFSWPKSMRWGTASISTESLRWVRPLSGIVAILGEDLVECEVSGIASGYATLGHRFHCRGASQGKVRTGLSDSDATIKEGEITIGSADDYAAKLRACHVIVDHEERAAIIREGAAKAASDAGLTLVEDEGLVVENAGLTEWPVPLLGRFEEDYLDVPPEVIQLTARVNQKYFVCEDAPGKLAPKMANAFICTSNIDPVDPAVVVDGNRKVLAARLSDARFFWELDRKTTLADHAKKLERITFHDKLGTVADKVERVAKLASWLVEEGIVKDTPLPSAEGAPDKTPLPGGEGLGVGVPTPQAPSTHPQPLPSREGASLADLAEQAARLCKADLVTEMVGEFPELQGLMGGYYARAEGLPDEIADAIRDHYKPVGQGDDVPTAPVTVAVSLADKLDTLVGFFAISEKPTGSKDPFALRRQALATVALIVQNNLRASLISIIGQHDIQGVWDNQTAPVDTPDEMFDFFAERLKVQQREAGVRHDLIDAVFALGGEDDLVRLLARVHALQAFIETENGTNLLAGYKRAANILKKSPLPSGEGPGVGGATPEASDTHPQPLPPREAIIEHTGDEDPLENVDDPEMREVYAAQVVQTSGLSYTPEPAEKALIDALDATEPQAATAIEQEDFAAAMAALASLRAPIDAFFDEVTVNDDDEIKRRSRLELLARFRVAVHNVADFSKIEG